MKQLALIVDNDTPLPIPSWQADWNIFWEIWLGWQGKEKQPAMNLFKQLVTDGKTLKIEGEANFYNPTGPDLIDAARNFIRAEMSKPGADPQYTMRARKWMRNAGWIDAENDAAEVTIVRHSPYSLAAFKGE